MISQKTCERIWKCHREIAAGEQLLTDLAALKEDAWKNDHARQLKDAFGRRRDFQLGIPSGENSHRLYDVKPDLAEAIIRAHIAHKQAELIEANEAARVELDSVFKDQITEAVDTETPGQPLPSANDVAL